MMPVAPELLQILACPKCKGSLLAVPGDAGLACRYCGLLYPILEDIPVMLTDEALPWRPEERPGEERP